MMKHRTTTPSTTATASSTVSGVFIPRVLSVSPFQRRARKSLLSSRSSSSSSGGAIHVSIRCLVVTLTVVLLVVYTTVGVAWWNSNNNSIPSTVTTSGGGGGTAGTKGAEVGDDKRSDPSRRAESRKDFMQLNNNGINQYDGWKALAQNLAALPAAEALAALLQNDPFGVRQFEKSLFLQETRSKQILTLHQLQQLFTCPPDDQRITLPDSRNHTQAQAFRNADPGTFLFFQHLRKAGGTNFCSLAEKNLPTQALPKYYCMPDMAWSGNKNAGYLHHWSNQDIITKMKQQGHRIAGNEWDNFDTTRHFQLPAVFATSFRKPLDRALSQFRFECIEDRGCSIKNVNEWWKRRTDLINVYTGTFADPSSPPRALKTIYEGTSQEDARKRRQLMGVALDTLSRFHLILVMEWLAYAAPLVKTVLGFDDTSSLTERVRPHINQHQRHDGQDVNKLGSAGISKASWVPEEYLDPKQYKIMSEHLVMDEILTDAARRMFLERLVCSDF